MFGHFSRSVTYVKIILGVFEVFVVLLHKLHGNFDGIFSYYFYYYLFTSRRNLELFYYKI